MNAFILNGIRANTGIDFLSGGLARIGDLRTPDAEYFEWLPLAQAA